MIHDAPVYAYRFYDENKKASKYWRDIGTLDAYYEANMDLCHVNPEFNLYDPEWPMRTLPAAGAAGEVRLRRRGRSAAARRSTRSSRPGCIISGSRVSGSVLCPNVRVHSFCDVSDSILMPGRARRPARENPPRASSTATCSSRAARASATTPKRIASATPSPNRGIVVVTTDDEPLVWTRSPEVLAVEGEWDERGADRQIGSADRRRPARVLARSSAPEQCPSK